VEILTIAEEDSGARWRGGQKLSEKLTQSYYFLPIRGNVMGTPDASIA
jgi:hypothetical protein